MSDHITDSIERNHQREKAVLVSAVETANAERDKEKERADALQAWRCSPWRIADDMWRFVSVIMVGGFAMLCIVSQLVEHRWPWEPSPGLKSEWYKAGEATGKSEACLLRETYTGGAVTIRPSPAVVHGDFIDIGNHSKECTVVVDAAGVWRCAK